VVAFPVDFGFGGSLDDRTQARECIEKCRFLIEQVRSPGERPLFAAMDIRL
jgi:hypothetical protein